MSEQIVVPKKGFTHYDDEKLVDCIRNHPLLYNKRHKDYRNFAFKNRAWVNIAETIGKDVDQCKGRWKDIRDNYFKILRRSKQTDLATPSLNRWQLYPQLSFLIDQKTVRQSSSNPTSETQPESEDEITYEEEDNTSNTYTEDQYEHNDQSNVEELFTETKPEIQIAINDDDDCSIKRASSDGIGGESLEAGKSDDADMLKFLKNRRHDKESVEGLEQRGKRRVHEENMDSLEYVRNKRIKVEQRLDNPDILEYRETEQTMEEQGNSLEYRGNQSNKNSCDCNVGRRRRENIKTLGYRDNRSIRRENITISDFNTSRGRSDNIEMLDYRDDDCRRRGNIDCRDDQDEIDLFMKSMALSVKKLPPHLIVKAKLEILKTVTKIEEEALGING